MGVQPNQCEQCVSQFLIAIRNLPSTNRLAAALEAYNELLRCVFGTTQGPFFPQNACQQCVADFAAVVEGSAGQGPIQRIQTILDAVEVLRQCVFGTPPV
ncbi:hypothetical protein [Alkalihalobacterium elongatum]|uniref:hypothetical protein n=1 Tax=Alkalihalobacterium elongatum TaxID=2675466 RepID=UPI001C1FAED7|nr:hypothetical protein [Alkalihalobacterium elongatum]